MLNIGLKMKLLESGVSQIELARRLGISDSRVSKILRGWVVPSSEIKLEIASLLGCEVSEIFPLNGGGASQEG